MERRVIPSEMNTVFEYDYSVQAEDMRGLYEKAKRDQWNASRDIAWDAPEPDDGRTLADELVDIYGSPIWAKLSEKERVELNRRITAWRLSVLVYGEQGALLACSQLVNMVSGADQKFFQATQVQDEARHNEVLERYIAKRLDGLHYPMPDNERVLFDSILTDSRWYIKTIALQLGVGLRSVQRRVRQLIDLAGVHTRIQLGWHARDRQWLDELPASEFDEAP